jgi:hypothetical protein
MKQRSAQNKVRRPAPVFAFTGPRPPLLGFTKEIEVNLSRQPPAWMLPANRVAPSGSAHNTEPNVAALQAVGCGGSHPCDPGSHQKETLGRATPRVSGRFLRSHPRRIGLGRRSRRDPAAADSQYHGCFRRASKTGTFYFARKRKFLLCRDRCLRPIDNRVESI